MRAEDLQHVYGPVPSRRLGRSLGIDLVPLKTCTYDCVYCQLGRTTNKTVEHRAYVTAEVVLAELEHRLESVAPAPDYIGVAGSGEPTLNSEIGRVIEGIKKLTPVPVAVLTNGSLLWMTEVQEALMPSDVVLPSLDAGDARLFERVNRPHPDISFEKMVQGLVSFTERYPREVWLEVLLLAALTGVPAEAEKIAALTRRIGPARVQLNTVRRPPSDQSARSLSEDEMRTLRDLFPGQVDIVSHACEEQIAAPGSSPEDLGVDVLALLRRRPCSARDVAEGLGLHINEATKRLDFLTRVGAVTTTSVDGLVFYAAALAGSGKSWASWKGSDQDTQSSCLDDLSDIARTHAARPRNYGRPEDFDGHARITGPCGKTMEFWLAVQNGQIMRAFFTTDGGESSIACGSMCTCMACGRRVAEAMAIGQQDILEALGGLPCQWEHCALLTARTFEAACGDYVNHPD